jgi:Zn-dependent protease
MGAIIFQRRASRSAFEDALIGIGGPAFGTVAALGCLGLSMATRSRLFLGLAYTGALINLFNMTPIFPLDGGWITEAVSPRLWLAGAAILGGLLLTGFLRNPFILVLLLVSLPRIWHGLRTGETAPGILPATRAQRACMGLAYIGLCALLAFLVAHAHERGARG